MVVVAMIWVTTDENELFAIVQFPRFLSAPPALYRSTSRPSSTTYQLKAKILLLLNGMPAIYLFVAVTSRQGKRKEKGEYFRASMPLASHTFHAAAPSRPSNHLFRSTGTPSRPPHQQKTYQQSERTHASGLIHSSDSPLF